jgi:DNA-directed RNA polymerase subunit RPC12/RpoP
MARNYIFICSECGEDVEYHRPSNYDGPTFCPECRSVDTLRDIEDEEISTTISLADLQKEQTAIDKLFSDMNEVFLKKRGF